MVTQSSIELKKKKKRSSKRQEEQWGAWHTKSGWNIKTGYWEWENTLIKIIWSLKSLDVSSYTCPQTWPWRGFSVFDSLL